LSNLAAQVDKAYVEKVYSDVLDGHIEDYIPSEMKCPDGHHAFDLLCYADEYFDKRTGVFISRVRYVCKNCGFQKELLSQPLTIDRGEPMKTHKPSEPATGEIPVKTNDGIDIRGFMSDLSFKTQLILGTLISLAFFLLLLLAGILFKWIKV
jgi:hypothetical protein